MTRSDAELDIGGTGSVLAIWSILIVVIGAALFAYSLVVTFRGRRNRRRRRRPPHGHPGGQVGRPMPPPPASRPVPQSTGPMPQPSGPMPQPSGPMSQPSGPMSLPSGPLSQPARLALPAGGVQLPSGPTAGGVPLGRHAGLPRPPAALPPGPHSRPLPLPGAPVQRFPSAPPPVGLPTAGSPPALPSGLGLPPGQVGSLPSDHPPALPAGPVVGTGYGTVHDPRHPGPTTYGTTYGTPSQGSSTASGTTDGAAPGSSTYGRTTGGTTYGSTTHTEPPVSAVPGRYGATIGTADLSQTVRTEPPATDRKSAKTGRRGRPDPCAALRSECEQLRELSAAAAAAATQAATDAEGAHADFVTAQRTADETRRALEDVVREATEVANQVATLDRAPTDAQEKLQAETSHAAFAAYRRGDISAEQLREVFKRAEGWTPEHERLSRRSNELRAQETELTRIRDAAILAEQVAGDRARTAAITARGLDERARTAAVDARGRCAAADACEQRGRHR